MSMFTDKDTVDKVTYKATSKSSAVKIMEIDSMNRIVVDVVRFDGASFPIVVEASDGHGGTERIELDVYTTNPLADIAYRLRELPNVAKDFASLKVYERHITPHTATFTDLTRNELGFATVAIAKDAPKHYQPHGQTYPTTTTFPGTKAAAFMPDASTGLPTKSGIYFTVEATSGPISGVALKPVSGGDPQLDFKVSGSGSATVTVKVHIAYEKVIPKPTTISQATYDNLPTFTVATTPKVINLIIVKVRGSNTAS